MAGPTLVKIKRSQGVGATATPGSLANGELAYTSNGDVLFIGIEDAVVAIGGERVPGTATANQALVVNSTGMIDQIDFGNSTVNTFANSLGFHMANSTVSISLVKPTTAEAAGSYYLKADGSWSTVTGATADPAGSDTHIQYNDTDVMGGSAGFTFNDTSNTLHVGMVANNLFVFDGGTAFFKSFTHDQTQMATFKIKWKSGDIQIKVNDTIVLTQADTFTMVGLDQVSLGKGYGGSGNSFEGNVQYIKVYDSATDF